MKKILIYLALFALMFSLTSCTDKAVTEENGKVTENAEDTPEDVTDTNSMFSDIDVENLPKEEEGKKTVSEDFASLPDMIEAQHVTDNFSMILTFYFEDGKAVNGHVTSIYKDIAQAKSVYDSYVKNTEYYANVTREEGRITYTHTETSFEAYKDMTKEEVKASLIEGNFEITKE